MRGRQKDRCRFVKARNDRGKFELSFRRGCTGQFKRAWNVTKTNSLSTHPARYLLAPLPLPSCSLLYTHDTNASRFTVFRITDGNRPHYPLGALGGSSQHHINLVSVYQMCGHLSILRFGGLAMASQKYRVSFTYRQKGKDALHILDD